MGMGWDCLRGQGRLGMVVVEGEERGWELKGEMGWCEDMKLADGWGMGETMSWTGVVDPQRGGMAGTNRQRGRWNCGV